jgi:hypothetical protein
MSTRRSPASASDQSPTVGYLIENQTSDLVRSVMALNANFLFDPSLSPESSHAHIARWASHMANDFLTNGNGPSRIPLAFAAMDSSDAIFAAEPSTATQLLKTQVFHADTVKQAASPAGKVLAAINAATGRTQRSGLTFRSGSSIAANVIEESNFDLRTYVGSKNPSPRDLASLEAVFASRKESTTLQVMILLSLIIIITQVSPRSTHYEHAPVPDDNPMTSTVNVLEDMASMLSTPSLPPREEKLRPSRKWADAAQARPPTIIETCGTPAQTEGATGPTKSATGFTPQQQWLKTPSPGATRLKPSPSAPPLPSLSAL